MIRGYNTNRDATRQFINGAAFFIFLLGVTPPILSYAAPYPPTPTATAIIYVLCYTCSLSLSFYCVYRYYHWGVQDDACLLSAKTLAILRRGRPARFVKPKDVVALRRDGMRLVLADGSVLRLPRNVDSRLPHDIVTTWYGKEFLEKASKAYRNAIRPSAKAITVGIVLVALALLIALALALAGLWREFARFGYGAFIAGYVIGVIYMFFQGYRAGKVVCPVPVPSVTPLENAQKRDVGHSRYAGIPIQVRRCPEETPRAIEHAGLAILVLIGLCIFIPMCRMVLAYETIEEDTRRVVFLVASDLSLVALYTFWHLYRNTIRADTFTTMLLSPRTIAIVCPRKPVRFIKPDECVSLVCGHNELVLLDGRTVKLPKDMQLDEERTVCKTLCQQWWPEAYGEEPGSIWTSISMRCRRQIVAGLVLVAVGFVFLILNSSPWGTALGIHLIVPGGILAFYGYCRGLRGYGRVIELPRQGRD